MYVPLELGFAVIVYTTICPSLMFVGPAMVKLLGYASMVKFELELPLLTTPFLSPEIRMYSAVSMVSFEKEL